MKQPHPIQKKLNSPNPIDEGQKVCYGEENSKKLNHILELEGANSLTYTALHLNEEDLWLNVHYSGLDNG